MLSFFLLKQEIEGRRQARSAAMEQQGRPLYQLLTND